MIRKNLPGKKKRMSTASRKAKGRGFQDWVEKQVARITGIESGKDKLIEKREMGQAGTDLKLYGIAKEKFPFSVECKKQESWAVHSWIEQAKSNLEKGTDWLLVCTRNRSDKVVIMDAEAFFTLWEKHLVLRYGKDHKDKNN